MGHLTRGWCLMMFCRGSNGYLRMKAWNYGLVATEYVHLAGIQSQSSQVAHQRARTWQFWEDESSHWKECWWHLQCHKKPGGKNAHGTPNRGHQVSIITQENLKLAAFLFHQRWRCTLDWEVTQMHEDTVHLLGWHKKLMDKFKDPRQINLIWQGWWRPSKSISDHVKMLWGHHWHTSFGKPY